MKVYGVIPARLESTRLPGKVLLDKTGKPLIQHTWERVCKTETLSDVYILSDSRDVRDVAHGFGANVIATSAVCRNGTERVVEARNSIGDSDDGWDDFVVNIQADEVEINPAHIDLMVRRMSVNRMSEIPMWTLAAPVSRHDMVVCDDVVKVVVNSIGRAIYFSRLPIPYGGPWLRHIGVYGYRRELLETWPTIVSALEASENLEQMRAIENDIPIGVVTVDAAGMKVDTQQDYDLFVERCKNRD